VPGPDRPYHGAMDEAPAPYCGRPSCASRRCTEARSRHRAGRFQTRPARVGVGVEVGVEVEVGVGVGVEVGAFSQPQRRKAITGATLLAGSSSIGT
jgi:hypothetical protein